MGVSPITRPSATEGEDLENLARASDYAEKQRQSKYVQTATYHFDPRLTKGITWVSVFLNGTAVAVSIFLITMLHSFTNKFDDLVKDVAVLMAKPDAISKEEFDREMTHYEHRLDNDEQRLNALESEIKLQR